MATRVLRAPAPPVGVIESVSTGFETVTGKLILILLPLALDLFLWLGPRLSVRPLVLNLLSQIGRLVDLEPSVAPVETAWRAILMPVAQRFNLLSLLSVPAVPRVGCLPGAWCLPSLMAVRAPVTAPSGAPLVIQVGSWLEVLTLVVALYLIGLFLGACYLGAIAVHVRDARVDLRVLLRQVWGWWARLVAFAALVAAGVVVFMVPVTVAALIAGQVLGELGMLVVYFAGASVGLWVLFYMAFVVHGMILLGRGLFGAIRDSARVVQWNLPSTVGLFAVTAAVSFGLSVIWSIPAESSWLSLVGIAGHAYVVTGLAAGTFVFFKDRYRWSAELREYLAARAQAERRKT
jgi:hypothetical protein